LQPSGPLLPTSPHHVFVERRVLLTAISHLLGKLTWVIRAMGNHSFFNPARSYAKPISHLRCFNQFDRHVVLLYLPAGVREERFEDRREVPGLDYHPIRRLEAVIAADMVFKPSPFLGPFPA
jgi:hypothetical protein